MSPQAYTLIEISLREIRDELSELLVELADEYRLGLFSGAEYLYSLRRDELIREYSFA